MQYIVSIAAISNETRASSTVSKNGTISITVAKLVTVIENVQVSTGTKTVAVLKLITVSQELQLSMAVFLHCCPDYPSCLDHLNIA